MQVLGLEPSRGFCLEEREWKGRQALLCGWPTEHQPDTSLDLA